MSEMQATVIIKGLVQGVYFRIYTKERAIALGLKGYVRNLSFGYVEAVFIGSEDRLKQIIDWCYEGPPLAKVSDLEVKWCVPNKVYYNFEIYY